MQQNRPYWHMKAKWLDKVFQSQYLPSLSINYFATNKHLEKIATTVVLDKEGNLS